MHIPTILRSSNYIRHSPPPHTHTRKPSLVTPVATYMHCCPSAEDLRACTGVRRALVPAGVLCAGVGESHAAVGRVQRVQRLHQRRRQRVQEAAAVEMGALQAPGAGDWLVQHAAQLGRVGSGQSGIAGMRDERGGA